MTNRLTTLLVEQANNELFYEGNVQAGSRVLLKQVVEGLEVDRCSIWLYDKDKTCIEMQQLYSVADDTYSSGFSLYRKDYEEYFSSMEKDPVIIADGAETHEATACLLESYLKPLGIKSMLDVPIWHRGKVIGVICMESLKPRRWLKGEIDFVQILSSLYSFAYSVNESTKMWNNILELEKFIDTATLITRADAHGRITYVNKKFVEVSGYTAEESIGQNHRLVNSGEHSKEFWQEMYRVVLKEKGIWNAVVTNRTKNGDLYYVDTYIKAEFDQENGKLLGYISIRQDVSDIVKSSQEIEKKNTYLEHAAKIIRHDMHSGINTYIPRGLSSLERRLSDETAKELKIEAPIKMIKEGLRHTQKVYKGVYEFTNLVKKDAILNRAEYNLNEILVDYLTATAYRQQVHIEDLGVANVNEPLFCTAVDNLIRNGLKYNDSNDKRVRLYREGDVLCIEDNGRGLTREEFLRLSQPYVRKAGQKEPGSGLGLNISIAIFEEHCYTVDCKRLEGDGSVLGTKIMIRIK